MPNTPRPKSTNAKTRARWPKVRTGCITCKVRRVKCDEQKPECLRCIKFGWQCDGYLQDRGSSSVSKRVIAAKNHLCLLNKPSQEPAFALFENDIEGKYYRLFVEMTASSLGGYYDPDLWNRIILQASIGVSSIRHVVIALAALDLTSMTTTFQPAPYSSTNGQDSSGDAYWRHQFALRQYSRAIKEMREDISNTTQDLRTTMIATILIVCFEAYHGNYGAALAQFRSGQKVLDEWKANQKHLVEDGISSTAPHIVEEEVIRQFTQLEIQAITHTDDMPLDTHLRMKDCGESGLAKMPKIFHRVEEAMIFGKLIMRRSAHFITSVWMYDDDQSTAPDTSFSIQDRVSSCTNPEAFCEQKKYLRELAQWHDAFLPILHEARTPAGNDLFFAATCLQIHYLITYFGIAACLATNELFYDSFTPLFVEVVALSKVVFELSQKSNFTCAFRAIFPLDVVAKKCRDPKIRREAIQLLLNKPRREIFWDSIIAAKVCLWVVNIEEEGMVGNYVTEEMRVRNVAVKFSSDQRKLFVYCKQRKKGSSHEMVLKEDVIML